MLACVSVWKSAVDCPYVEAPVACPCDVVATTLRAAVVRVFVPRIKGLLFPEVKS